MTIRNPSGSVLRDHIDEDPRLRFGTSRHGSISLDIEQATKLANELIQSINEYNGIDSDCGIPIDTNEKSLSQNSLDLSKLSGSGPIHNE
jgi:hypothetical protein